MFNKILNLFQPKLETPSMKAARELYEAEMDLLKAQKEREYWHSMVVMLEDRTTRLTNYLNPDN